MTQSPMWREPDWMRRQRGGLMGMKGPDDQDFADCINAHFPAKPKKVTIGLHATEELKTNSESIEDAIDYAQTSGGRIRAKDSDGGSFLSTTSQKTTTLPENSSGEGPLIVRAARFIREVFGR